MDLLLGKHGTLPTEENVRAIVEASKPQTPSEVRSFLRLVGFSAKFIPDFAATADPHRRLDEARRTVYVGLGSRGIISEIEEASG